MKKPILCIYNNYLVLLLPIERILRLNDTTDSLSPRCDNDFNQYYDENGRFDNVIIYENIQLTSKNFLNLY